MSKDTERAPPPLHIHFGNRMLEDAARDIVDVVKRVERGESVTPQRHLSFEGWDTLAHALRVAGLDGQTSVAVIAALKGMAEVDEWACQAPGDSPSPGLWERSALANLRRKWLHYHALGERTVTGQRVADDLAPLVPAFEAACDEVDRLRQGVDPGIAFPDRPQPAPSDESRSVLDVLRQDEVEDDDDFEAPRAFGDTDALLQELQRLRQDCADAYQVVGSLGAAAGVLDSPEVIKALDNLSAASHGEARRHEGLLPFILTRSHKE
ncbi:hypothetical protein [Azospirillum soli]|uniref:hypothetical protein n=1 Tax=Azospirillum soli TaxID=1304799 RepID=UPI001AE399D3|nr:hypothetical protein [Azospirillum soli]MBP2316937.1 hypothetical protein [Azospirillum soli]